MKRFVILFSLLAVVMPSIVWAEETTTTTDTTTSVTSTICSCYCKTSGGAMNIGVQNSTNDCNSACNGTSGYSLLGCYTEAQDASTPENSQLCWTEYECTTQVEGSTDTTIGTEDQTYEWGGQSSSCISGEGHCYKPMPPITLGVAIEDMTTATDLPSYLNAIYNWLIPAGALLAIVMIMLGGLQYALAHGEKGKITKATDRIKNALIGMILLMFTYAILNLIDPNLVTFNNLRVPQIRTVVYLDPNSTCEMMSAYGITITPTTAETSCGNTGSVTSVEGYIGGGETTLSVGATCTYSACTDEAGLATNKTCLGVASAPNGFACVSCSDSYNDALIDYQPNPDAPVTSASTCSSLLYPDPNPSDGEKYYCEFYDTAITELTQADACAELVYPGGLSPGTNLDCDLLISDAQAGDSISCRMYDNVWAKVGNYAAYNIAYSNEVDDLETSDTFPLLTSICEADPCGLAPPGHSCKVFIVTPEDAVDLALGTAGTVGATMCAGAIAATLGGAAIPCGAALVAFALGAVAAEVVTDSVTLANCAPDDSASGLYYCTDKYGNTAADCNPTW